jgi:hypothetical protein
LKSLFIFLDEAGNDDFTPSGTKYLILTSVATEAAALLVPELYQLKHDICEAGVDLEYFHATRDKQWVRDRVFGLLVGCAHLRVDSLIVEKAKTHPSIANYLELYPRMSFYLLRFVLHRFDLAAYDHIFIFMDYLAVKGKREALVKGIKEAISPLLAGARKYSIHQHRSMSHPYLQVTDYYCWAIYRKWESGDDRSYELIRHQVESEFDIFRRGKERFYK